MVIKDLRWSLIKLTRRVNLLVPSQSLFQPMVDHPNWDSSIRTHKIAVKEYDFEMSDGTWLRTGRTASPEESLRESVSSSASLSSVLSQLKTRGHFEVKFGVKFEKIDSWSKNKRSFRTRKNWDDSWKMSFLSDKMIFLKHIILITVRPDLFTVLSLIFG